MKQQKHTSYNLFKNFKYSFIGIYTGFKNEPNLSIQLLLGIFISIALVYQDKPFYYLIMNLLAMSAVMAMELMNTSVEYFCDFVEPNKSSKVKFIKDVSSGAVLTSALGWLAVIIYALY